MIEMVTLQRTNGANGTRVERVEKTRIANTHTHEASSSQSNAPLPKPSKPMFTTKPISTTDEVTQDLDELFIEYNSKVENFKFAVSFDKYLKITGKTVGEPRKEKRQLHQKMTIPTFNGQDGLSARAWLQKL